MTRFLIGVLFGIALTAEALFLSAAGHGSYAPWVFVASLIALVPLLSLVAGPLLWALYFLFIPNLERLQARIIALLLVGVAHFLPGCWLAYEDPAFKRSSPIALSVFFVTLLAATAMLLFFVSQKGGDARISGK